MLVFSVKNNTGFWVGDAYVQVIKASGGTAKIGVEAPREIIVDRDKIRQRKLDGTPPPRKT